MFKAALASEEQSGNVAPLITFIVAAILARTATGGSAVAVILLAREYGANGKLAGALAACLTLPHLLGPIYGGWIERTTQPRYLLSLTAMVYSFSFYLAIWGFEAALPLLFTPALLLCGVCSSFIMGGLSTQLVGLVGTCQYARRKAQGWDTITYAIGTTCGPLLLAFITSYFQVAIAAAAMVSLAIVASGFILRFPTAQARPKEHKQEIPDLTQVFQIFQRSAALKRTVLMTSAASFSVAALPVLAVYLAEFWQFSKENGALLVTAYGVGNLIGALYLIIRPLTTDALLLLRNVGLLLLVALGVVSMSQSFYTGLAGYCLVGVVNAIFFAVTLAARTDYAPEKGAAQVYMWVAAAKIGAASVGALVAGFLVDQAVILPLLCSCLVLILVFSFCFFHRGAFSAN